jgi:hypothetical protein
MTPMRRVLLVVAGVLLLLPTAAIAYPVYNGDQRFPAISEPEDPEDYAWEVTVGENQELRQIDETRAGVFYEGGPQAFGIEAEAAHDAEGKTVPTTLTVTEPNVITLTVHHRNGNPAAAGAPFDYPVVAGEGWEGGFESVKIVGPPDESELAQPPIQEILNPPPSTCVVPDLSNRTLHASRKILHRAHCKLGRVRGERRREVRVVEQYRLVGRVLPVWTAVDVRALKVVQGIPAID